MQVQVTGTYKKKEKPKQEKKKQTKDAQGCKECNGKSLYCSCGIVKDFIPVFGMGSIILDEMISTLKTKPIISFFPVRNQTTSSFLLYNVSKDDTWAASPDITSEVCYIFSAFFENISCIAPSDLVKTSFQGEQVPGYIKDDTKKVSPLTITCKKHPKTGEMKITNDRDLNGFKHSYVPNMTPFVITDPFTAALLSDTGICWFGAKDNDYRIDCVLVEEEEAIVSTTKVQALRKRAIREANDVIKKGTDVTDVS